MRNEKDNLIKGISVCHPIEIDKDYLLFTIDYATKMGFDHIQICGPIHDGEKGNIDGMTLYRKYSRFNNEKNIPYVERTLDAVNTACRMASENGIKTYMWHHELELPTEFKSVYPEVLNSDGDIEVTHPIVKDFLEHKIADFFFSYPYMDGIILTLHETKIPLLKLKHQKLDKIERVKYVTQILFEACKVHGKNLIVRPFASIEEDYVMMAKAYEEISQELVIMDKWTQFDWSLTMPHNSFFHKLNQNPLLVEADIFGEYFGKGRLPLMLKEHIAEKFAYCDEFSPKGYVARIDRAGQTPFGDVNEINVHIFHSWLYGIDAEQVIDEFFRKKYPYAANEVRALMEETEEILKKTIYANGYYFSELSFFPTLNHCKNHYYFEMMRSSCDIKSNEWYIPREWNRGSVDGIIEEKQCATRKASKLFDRLIELSNKIESGEYRKLWVKFCNLKLVTEAWEQLTRILFNYVQFFDTRDEKYAIQLEKEITRILEINNQGVELLGTQFYCLNSTDAFHSDANIQSFVDEIRDSFQIERELTECIEKEQGVLDYIICGGAMEGHRLQKEVNFSDTLVRNRATCRIPGNRRGMQWSTINAHGWFSYEIKVRPNSENMIKVTMESVDDELNVRITLGTQEYVIQDRCNGRKEYALHYTECEGNDSIRIRFDKISGHTPCIFTIKVI